MKKSKSKELTDRQVTELSELKRKNGLLRPVDVVEFARNRRTALHRAFEWDDSKAAQAYRIWQARQLIVSVTIVEPNTKREIPMFVSLKDSRSKPGGGYHETVQVLSKENLRDQLLSQALQDFAYWRAKYEVLHELATVFQEMERVENRLRKSKKKTG